METKIISQKQKAENRHWKNYLDKDYLGSHNLEQGEEMLLTIAKFVGEESVKGVEGGKPVVKTKPVLYFKEDVPKMIMNITNGNTLSALYGSHPENWIGKQIQLYSVTGKFFGKEQEALRIRDFVPRRDINVAQYTQILSQAKSVTELGAIWGKLPHSVKLNKEVEAYKDKMKAELSKQDIGQDKPLPVIEMGSGEVDPSQLPPDLR